VLLVLLLAKCVKLKWPMFPRLQSQISGADGFHFLFPKCNRKKSQQANMFF